MMQMKISITNWNQRQKKGGKKNRNPTCKLNIPNSHTYLLSLSFSLSNSSLFCSSYPVMHERIMELPKRPCLGPCHPRSYSRPLKKAKAIEAAFQVLEMTMSWLNPGHFQRHKDFPVTPSNLYYWNYKCPHQISSHSSDEYHNTTERSGNMCWAPASSCTKCFHFVVPGPYLPLLFRAHYLHHKSDYLTSMGFNTSHNSVWVYCYYLMMMRIMIVIIIKLMSFLCLFSPPQGCRVLWAEHVLYFFVFSTLFSKYIQCFPNIIYFIVDRLNCLQPWTACLQSLWGENQLLLIASGSGGSRRELNDWKHTGCPSPEWEDMSLCFCVSES